MNSLYACCLVVDFQSSEAVVSAEYLYRNVWSDFNTADHQVTMTYTHGRSFTRISRPLQHRSPVVTDVSRLLMVKKIAGVLERQRPRIGV